jgi:hypothetical protein
MKGNGLMSYNSDGFNNRMVYINNANDVNRINRNGPSNSDSSVAQMRIAENKPDIQTVNFDKKEEKVEARGSRENFILRNNNMMNINKRVNPNNPVNNAMNRNIFKKFN